LADLDFRVHCGIAIRAVSENAEVHFKVEGKTQELAVKNEREKEENKSNRNGPKSSS